MNISVFKELNNEIAEKLTLCIRVLIEHMSSTVSSSPQMKAENSLLRSQEYSARRCSDMISSAPFQTITLKLILC
jgi:hypothetical protein